MGGENGDKWDATDERSPPSWMPCVFEYNVNQRLDEGDRRVEEWSLMQGTVCCVMARSHRQRLELTHVQQAVPPCPRHVSALQWDSAGLTSERLP